MLSRNSRDHTIRRRPSLIPIRKTNRNINPVGSQEANSQKDDQNKSSQKVSSEKETQVSFMKLLAKLKKDYLDSIPHKSSSSSKEDEDQTSESDLAVFLLPPPTRQFYNNAFLEYVTYISTHNQVSCEDNNLQDDTHTTKVKKAVNNDENNVEKSRRQTEKIDSFIQMGDMEKEEQLVDVNIDFDTIVYEDAEKSLFDMDNIIIPKPKANEDLPEFLEDNNKNEDKIDKEDATGISYGSGSWLLFDSEGEFVGFKPNCGDNKFDDIFEDDDDTGNAFLGMEKILTGGGYMSPIKLGEEKMRPESSNQQQSRQVVEQNNPNINNSMVNRDYDNRLTLQNRYHEQYLTDTSSPYETQDKKDTKEKKGKKRIIYSSDSSSFGISKRKYGE